MANVCSRCGENPGAGSLACDVCGAPRGAFAILQRSFALVTLFGFAALWVLQTPLTGGQSKVASLIGPAGEPGAALVAVMGAVLVGVVGSLAFFGKRLLVGIRQSLQRPKQPSSGRLLFAQFLVAWVAAMFLEALVGALFMSPPALVVEGSPAPVSYAFGAEGVSFAPAATDADAAHVLALRADGGWGTPKGAKRVAHVTIAPLDSGSLTARLNWRMGSGELRLSAVASVGSSATQVSVNGEAVEGARVRLNPGDVLQIREFKATLGGSGWDRLVLGVAVGKTVSLLLLLLGCAQLGGRNLFGELGFTLRGARAEVGRGVVALLAFLPVYVVGVMLTQLIGSSLGIPVESHPLVHAILEQGGTQLVLLVILQAVVLAPILEELLFRGFLLSAGARALGRPLGLLLSALCFALIHAGFASFLPMLGLGLLFGVLRLSSPERSIVGSITAHALFNALSLTLLFAAG